MILLFTTTDQINSIDDPAFKKFWKKYDFRHFEAITFWNGFQAEEYRERFIFEKVNFYNGDKEFTGTRIYFK